MKQNIQKIKHLVSLLENETRKKVVLKEMLGGIGDHMSKAEDAIEFVEYLQKRKIDIQDKDRKALWTLYKEFCHS